MADDSSRDFKVLLCYFLMCIHGNEANWCEIEPLSSPIQYNQSLDLKFTVDCTPDYMDNFPATYNVRWYIPGYRSNLQDLVHHDFSELKSDIMFINIMSPCNSENISSFNISIKMTEAVHNLLNGAIAANAYYTAKGNVHSSCTSLSPARYYIESEAPTTPPDCSACMTTHDHPICDMSSIDTRPQHNGSPRLQNSLNTMSLIVLITSTVLLKTNLLMALY